jgi:hypothetical protein
MLCLYAPVMVAGALWPCPHKYPWILPAAVVASAVVSAALWKKGNDAGGAMVFLATVAGLATWTLAHHLQLGIVAGLLVFAASIAPAIVFVIVLASLAGAADDPRFDDE